MKRESVIPVLTLVIVGLLLVGGLFGYINARLLAVSHERSVHIDFTAGVTDVEMEDIPAGSHPGEDEYYWMIMLTLVEAPGGGKSVNVTITDGNGGLMNITISGADKFGMTEVGAFLLDVSIEDFTILYSQMAGGVTKDGDLMLHYYHVEAT